MFGLQLSNHIRCLLFVLLQFKAPLSVEDREVIFEVLLDLFFFLEMSLRSLLKAFGFDVLFEFLCVHFRGFGQDIFACSC